MIDGGLLLLMLPAVAITLAWRLFPSHFWLMTGISIGLVIVPASMFLIEASLGRLPVIPWLFAMLHQAHVWVAPASDQSAGLIWGVVYGVFGFVIDRFRGVRRKALKKVICTISKEEVLAKDISTLKTLIETTTRELDTLFSVVDSEGDAERTIQQHGDAARVLTEIVLTIDGYDSDPGPLWEYFGGDNNPEVREWAWSFLREMPYAMAFLELQSCMLVGLLCMGGLVDTNYDGFIPNFEFDPERTDEFLSLIEMKGALDRYMTDYRDLQQGVYLLVSVNLESIYTQFEEIKEYQVG